MKLLPTPLDGGTRRIASQRSSSGLFLAALIAFVLLSCISTVHAAPFTASTAASAPVERRTALGKFVQRLAQHLYHHSGSDGYGRDRYAPVPASPWVQSQHPLSRSLTDNPLDGAVSKRQIEEEVAAPDATTWDTGGQEIDDDVLASAAPVAASGAAARVDAAVSPSATEPGSASATSAAESAASQTGAATSATPTSASPAPSSSAAVSKPFASPLPSSSGVSSSSSNPSPSPAAKPARDEKDDHDDTAAPLGIFSHKNKLFPLVVVAISVAVILGLLLFIAIARALAHDRMRRKKIAPNMPDIPNAPDAYGLSKGLGDRLTSAAPGLSAARSIRRALTKKKIGSFARRQQQGSVLIDVGDEVFAVPGHLAESYRREMIRERRQASSSGASKQSVSDGPFGKVRPRHLTDGGPDVEGWRAKMAYDEQTGGNGNTDANKPHRTLSQRIADRLRALTRPTIEEDDEDSDGPSIRVVRSTPPNGKQGGAAAAAYSFDSDNQAKGAMRQVDLATHLPVLTHGSSDWQIRPSAGAIASGDAAPRSTPQGESKVPRKAVAYGDKRRDKKSFVPDASILSDKLSDLEKQANHSRSSSHNGQLSTSSFAPISSQLSHERVMLIDGQSPAASSLGHQTSMGTYAGSSDHASSHGHSTVSSGYTPSESSASNTVSTATTTTTSSERRGVHEQVIKLARLVESSKVEIQHARRAKSIHPVAVSTGTYRHRKAQHPSHQLIADRVNSTLEKHHQQQQQQQLQQKQQLLQQQQQQQQQQQRSKPSVAVHEAVTKDIQRSQSQHASSPSVVGGAGTTRPAAQRHVTSVPTISRVQSTTAAASPDLYRSRQFTSAKDGGGRTALTLRPEQPPRAAFLQASENISSKGIEGLRPLPMPPRLPGAAP
ncbi:hypothetical protein ACQY0O_001576 [Thecaphora frezii]